MHSQVVDLRLEGNLVIILLYYYYYSLAKCLQDGCICRLELFTLNEDIK